MLNQLAVDILKIVKTPTLIDMLINTLYIYNTKLSKIQFRAYTYIYVLHILVFT